MKTADELLDPRLISLDRSTSRTRTAGQIWRHSTIEHAIPFTMPNNAIEINQDESVLRLQRKRARDRKSQRKARERTKSRLSYMESLVNDMTSRDASGSTASLLQELTQVKQERDQLAKALEDMAKIITANCPSQQLDTFTSTSASTSTSTQGACKDRVVREQGAANIALPTSRNWLLNDDNGFDNDRELEPAARNIFPQPTGCQQVLIEPRFSEPQVLLPQSTCAQEEQVLSLAGAFSDSHSRPWTNVYPVDPVADLFKCKSDPIVPSPVTMCECNVPLQTHHPSQKSLWRSTNEVFLNTFQLPPSSADHMEEEMDEDLPVRAIVDGWDAAMGYWNLTCLPPSWQILRGLDEVLFARDSSKLQRLANLKLVHLRLRFLRAPSPGRLVKIPPWYHRRLSQEMPHSCAIDYIPWPGIRDRFIFQQHRYCSDLYWKMLAAHIRILWPFSFRDCYMTAGDKFQISPQFEARISDIKCWAMESEFFSQYPELYSDIPSVSQIPQSMPANIQQQLAFNVLYQRFRQGPPERTDTDDTGVIQARDIQQTGTDVLYFADCEYDQSSLSLF